MTGSFYKLRTSRGRWKWVALLSLAMMASSIPWSARGKVNPLHIIQHQINKANMLVLLDTSGSMVSPPGGTFDPATEVGVDCNEGVDCRGTGTLGNCMHGGQVCTTDSGFGLHSVVRADWHRVCADQ